MFKPFDYWSMERMNCLKQDSKTKPNLREEYSQIDDKTLLRHIKVAEHAFDLYTEDNKTTGSFHSYLNYHELTVLFQSYGLPKQFGSAKAYFLYKKQLNPKEGDIKWKALSEDDKKIYAVEFDQMAKENNKKFFEFSRNLPEHRVSDFLDYLLEDNQITTRQKEKSSPVKIEEPKRGDLDEIKLFKNKFAPSELYWEEHKNRFTESTIFLNKTRCRSEYTALDDTKKIIYVKKCEDLFDKYKFTAVNDEKPILSYIFSLYELKLLLGSYQFPLKPAANLHLHYFNKNAGDNKPDQEQSKKIYAAYNNLKDAEKAQLKAEYQKSLDDYEAQMKKCMAKLPAKRKIDVEYFLKKKKKDIVRHSTKKSSEVEMSDMEIENDVVIKEDFTENITPEPSQSSDKEIAITNFIDNYEKYSENTFSRFILNEIEDQSKKMDIVDSISYLNNNGLKWLSLSVSDKNELESDYKKNKKDFKKNSKKFIQENSELDISPDELKEHIKNHARVIHFKFADETAEELVLAHTKTADLFDKSVTTVEVKKDKKPKTVNGVVSSKRKIKNEDTSSPKTIKKNA